jgi:phosphoribosylaminoimidazole carboxylase (NCAIR synthetase)
MPDKTVVIEEYIHPAESLEVSVIVAIDYNNNTVHYEPVVMSFHSERNILGELANE